MDFNQKNIDWLKQHINKSDKVLLLVHDYPDGDAVGSLVVMCYATESLGAVPIVVLRNFDEATWSFADFKHEIKIYSNGELSKIKDIAITIVMDCSNEDRLGEQKALLAKSSQIVNIDHHADNNYFGVVNIVKDASSVGEILYYLLKRLNIKMTRKIAYCIIVSIASDTGRFKYNNTHKNLFAIIHDLFDYLEPNDYSEIMRNLYSEVSLDKIQYTGEILNNLEMLDGFVAFSFLETDCGFVDGLVESIQSIKGARASVLVRRIDNRIKISFRAKDINIDVQQLAKQFSGGGHIHASGATLDLINFLDQVADIKATVQQYFSKYK